MASQTTTGRTRLIQVLLSDSQNKRLKAAAKRSGVTTSAFIRVALEREFALEDQLAQECSQEGPAPGGEEGEKLGALQPLLF